jgi:outer membrane protein OmpA-like peptidoglycan-associated protein
MRAALTFLLLGSTLGADADPSRAISKIPLCLGLTVVTAISQKEGDYESIKTVTSLDGDKVQLKYSSEQPPEQRGGGLRIRKVNTTRTVHAADLLNANAYEQVFGTNIPSDIPGATAIGTSHAVLRSLKTDAKANLAMFDPPPAIPGSVKIPADRKQHPSLFDYAETYKLERSALTKTIVTYPVLVNSEKVNLRAVDASGRSDFNGYRAEFLFLDDEDNPLTLSFRLGIGAGKGGADRDTLKVIQIDYTCSGSADGQSWLERALAETGHADIYSIYFSFNSDELRDESEPTLREIGHIMRRHPDWKLSVAGHTDSIGGDASNLDLSKRRAASVKTALVERFGVNPGRLTTTGHGKSMPVDTNETEEGRARNRRVELVRLP